MASPLSNPNSPGAHSGREFEDLVANLFRQHGWRVKKEPMPADKGADLVVARRGGAALSFSRPGPTKCRKPSRSRMPTATSGANWERKLTKLFAALGEIAGAPTTASGAAGSGNAWA